MDDNEIIELDNNSEDTLYNDDEISTQIKEDEIIVNKDIKKKAVKEVAKKAKKEKKPNFFKRMSKKGKIIFICSIVFVILLITGIILYFTVFKKNDKDKEESIVLESSNYIYDNGKLKLLNSKEKVIGTYNCIDKDTKKCYVAVLDNEDNFDVEKYLNTNNDSITQNSKIYNDRFVFIYDDGHISLYDIETKKSKGKYKKIKVGSNSKDYVVLQNTDGKYGIMSILVNKAKTVVDFNFEYLGIINNDDLFVAKEGENYFLIDNASQKTTVNYVGEIRSFNDKYVSIYKDGAYVVYDYDGNIVTTKVDGIIDYVRFDGEYFNIIIDKKLYIYNSNMTCLNPSGIKLKNIYYNKTYIFDKDNELKQTYESYKTDIKEDSILVTLSDKSEIIINTIESSLNGSFAYVDYLDGTLIFYADELKTEKIGSYKCANKNTITKTSTSFDNCFIAKDESIVNKESFGYIPIINGNYVFINDTKDGATIKNIVLYNLSANKTEIKYQKVDTGLGNENVGIASTMNNVVYAQNVKGQYLAITFTSDGPKKIIDSSVDGVSTDKIEKYDNYLIVTRGKKKVLVDMIGTELASTTLDKIVEYKTIGEDGYLVSSDEKGKYSITNSNGKIVASDLTKYEFYDSFVIGITGNDLIGVYPLAGNKNICDKVNLTGKYEVKDNIIVVSGKEYVIDITNNKCEEVTKDDKKEESNSTINETSDNKEE